MKIDRVREARKEPWMCKSGAKVIKAGATITVDTDEIKVYVETTMVTIYFLRGVQFFGLAISLDPSEVTRYWSRTVGVAFDCSESWGFSTFLLRWTPVEPRFFLDKVLASDVESPITFCRGVLVHQSAGIEDM